MTRLLSFPVALILAGHAFSNAAAAQTGARYTGPVIDMHMHAANVSRGSDGKPLPVLLRAYPGPCECIPASAATEQEVLRLTLAAMDKHNVVLGFLSGYDLSPTSLTPNPERVQTWVKAAPGRFITSAFLAQPGSPTVEWLRSEFSAGRLQGLGEITTQYFGRRPDDPALTPYLALAAELDLPTHIHTAGIGAPLPTFRTSAGNPLALEEALARHPTLRLVVENSGFPFTQEWIAISYQYPQLYGEVSTTTWIVNQQAFKTHLRTLVEAGLGKRIMFGSDQMQWPETIGLAIEAIQSAEFLNAEQKADILYNNAARFLRLSEQEIARHHGR